MISVVALVVFQAVAGYAIAPYLQHFLSMFGAADRFVIAAALALLVWLTGWLGSVVLKGVAAPALVVLTAALIGALAIAALTLIPAISGASAAYLKMVPATTYPLFGAIAGYLLALPRR